MPAAAAMVPPALLLAPDLSPAAKLIWMALHVRAPATPGQLESASGLSRPTVLKALVRLVASGWCTAGPGGYRTAIRRPAGPAGSQAPATGSGAGDPSAAAAARRGASPAAARRPALATVPAALLANRRASIRAKILYGILQMPPQFHTPSVSVSYAAVCKLTGACGNTIKRAVRSLVAAGWLETSQRNRLASVSFILLNPAAAPGEAERARAERRIHFAGHKGEAIMQEYASLLLDSDEWQNNVRPGFLVNPQTDARMELDRYYPAGLAFEFQGGQHDGATETVSAAEAAAQQARDHMKLGICTRRGIALMEVRWEDLSLATMQRKVRAALEDMEHMRRRERLLEPDSASQSMAGRPAGDIPSLRDLTGYEPLIELLEGSSYKYQMKARGGG